MPSTKDDPAELIAVFIVGLTRCCFQCICDLLEPLFWRKGKNAL